MEGRTRVSARPTHGSAATRRTAVADLDKHIDELYKEPLATFTSARNALAKSLTGDEAKRVKALAKPTVVPWAANQVYWRARATYDRLLKSGERLRKAQIAALEGKSSDVRTATDQHRRAIADAVKEAERLAAAEGSKPAPDALMRTFEALSLAAEPPEPHGHLTEALQPAGFEALAGVTPGPAKVGRHVRAEMAEQDVRGVRLQADRDREREAAEAARRRDA